MTFSLLQGGVVMSIQITRTQSSTYRLYLIYLTSAPWYSVVAPFYSLSQAHHVTASHPSTGDNQESMGGQSERTQGQAKMAVWNSFSYTCTRAHPSFQSFVHWHAASTVIPLLRKATFTPSIQPNIGLPCTRPPLTSAINTLLAIRYSSILSTWLSHHSLNIKLIYTYIFL